MAVQRTYRLNLRNYGNLPAIMLSQYDEGYNLVFEIYDGASAADDLSAYTVTLKGIRHDELSYSFSGTISTNVLTFPIDTTMTACAGRGTAEIAIADTTNNVLFATFNLPVFVEKAAVPDGSIDADVERAEEVAAQVQEIVDTAAATVTASVTELEGEVDTNTANIATNTTAIGTLSNLTTDAKTNLVSAINEVDAHADTNAAAISSLNAELTANINSVKSDITALSDGRGEIKNNFLASNLLGVGTPETIELSTTSAVQTTYTWGITFLEAFEAVEITIDYNDAPTNYTCEWKRYTNGTGVALTTSDTLTLTDCGIVKDGKILALNIQIGDTITIDSAYLKTKQFTSSATVTGYCNCIGIKKSNGSMSIPARYQIGGTYTFYKTANTLAYKVEQIESAVNASQWDGKKCACIGDSIMWYDGNAFPDSDTVAVGYPSYLRGIGLDVDNYGVSGACVAYDEDSPEVDNVTTVDSIDFTQYDLVVLEGGINDYLRGTPLGEYSTSFDKTTLWGAYQYILEKILVANPTIQIVMFLPYHVAWGAGGSNTLQEYVETIEAIAEKYAIPLVDLYRKNGFNRRTYGRISTAGTYTIDGLHSNNDGYKRSSEIMLSVINKLGTLA